MINVLNEKALRGANYYSYRPVIVMTIDLGIYKETKTSELGDFVDRLLTLLPSLEDHRCSLGVRGGFIQRLREGTLLGHVIEHLAIELQYIAYMDVGFGKTLDTDQPGVFEVIFSYWVAKAGIFAGKEATNIVNNLLEGKSYDLETTIKELKNIRDDYHLGPSTAAIVDEAERRGITVIRLDDYNLVQLGEGKYQKRIQASITSNTSMIGVETAGNKRLTKRMLEDAGIPVPKGTIVRFLESAIDDANWLGYPVVVKPYDGHHGKGVSTNIQNNEALRNAFERSKQHTDRVIVEKYITGNDYRILVIDGKFVAAARRVPASVIGDGKHTIAELIEIENRNPRRGYGHENVMTRLQISSVTEHLLAQAGYSLDTVLKDEEIFFLELTANLSTGGSAVDVTDRVHSANKFMAERIARIVGLDIAGIDVIAPSLRQPIMKTGGAVIEVNAAPGLRMHLSPAEGHPRNVAQPIIDMLFPKGSKHDILITSVTGTNGKTTTVRLISHIMKNAGYSVGMTTTDGIYLRDRLIAEGDMSGPYSAKVVLQDPLVDCAVFETARGGILREGLGYTVADVGVVLNVQPDHLGLKSIHTVEQLAKVKAVVAEAVRRGGTTVLNADDPHCIEMAEHCRERIIFFSLRPLNPVIRAHVDSGNPAVVYDQGYITILDKEMIIPVARTLEMPFTMEGRAVFNIQNALAATAATYAVDVKIEEIRLGLTSFFPSPSQMPGRTNIIPIKGFDVMIDYAHNPSAYKNFIELILRLGDRRRILVIDAVGDRRDSDIFEIAKIVADHFENIILYEDKDLRGRNPGELIDILEKGLLQKNKDPKNIYKISDETEAIDKALTMAERGNLICFMTGRVRKAIDYLYSYKEKCEPMSQIELPEAYREEDE
ncbi:cyanophycin synthetase [bacterium]|nr:cyanophycin synthetase [candidate division CSSED10-310 bacterium]